MSTEQLEMPSGTCETGADASGVKRRSVLAAMAAAPAATAIVGAATTAVTTEAVAADATAYELNAYLELVGPNGAPNDFYFNLTIPRVESGQGILTSSAMLAATELGIDVSRVRPRSFNWNKFEAFATTLVGASGSTRLITDSTRRAAADVRARNGGGTNYGANAAAIAKSTATGLAKPWAYHGTAAGSFLGRGSKADGVDSIGAGKRVFDKSSIVPRSDAVDVVTGKAIYTCDEHMDALNCLVMHSFAVRAAPKTVDIPAIVALGASIGAPVTAVIPFDSKGNGFGIFAGVGIICETLGKALDVRRAIIAASDADGNSKYITWGVSPAARISTTSFNEKLRGAVGADPLLGELVSPKRIKGTILSPFHNQGTLGTQTAIAEWTADGVDLWHASQVPRYHRQEVCRNVGLATQPKKMRLRVTKGYGHFGRNLLVESSVESAMIAKKIFEGGGLLNPNTGKKTNKVKVMWSRNDDIRLAPFRPASLSRFIASIGADGKSIISLNHKYVTTLCELPSGVDNVQTETLLSATNQTGLDYFPLATPSFYTFTSLESFREVVSAMPTGAMRAVYSVSAVGHKEIFLDEVLRQTGQGSAADRYAVRIKYMKSPRIKNLLNTMQAKWNEFAALAAAGGPNGEKRGVGVGLHEEWGSASLAMVLVQEAEKGAGVTKPPKVLRAAMAVDQGRIVNGSGTDQNAIGAMADAVALVYFSKMTFVDGKAEQSTFLNYYWNRQRECDYDVDPTVMVNTTDDRVGGAGELSAPSTFGALGNAWADLNAKVLGAGKVAMPTEFPLYGSPSAPLTDA